MHKGLRVLLASTASLVSVPAFAWLAAELAAYYEIFSTGMNSRAVLGEDLGFGILLFMVVPRSHYLVRYLYGGLFGAELATRKFA